MGVIRRLIRLILLGVGAYGATVAAVLFCTYWSLESYGGGRSLASGAPPAIVLGSGSYQDGRLLRPTFRRVALSAELWKAGKIGVILFSGGPERNFDLIGADTMRSAAIELGVPDSAIVLERRSTSTFENLRYSREVLEAQGLGPPVLITDAMHMARTRALAAFIGLEISGVATSDGFHDTLDDKRLRFTLRESLAWWHNLGRALIWTGLGLLGLSDDERDQLLI